MEIPISLSHLLDRLLLVTPCVEDEGSSDYRVWERCGLRPIPSSLRDQTVSRATIWSTRPTFIFHTEMPNIQPESVLSFPCGFLPEDMIEQTRKAHLKFMLSCGWTPG